MPSRRELLLGSAGVAASLIAGCYSQPKQPYPFAPTPEEELRGRVEARVRSFLASAPDAAVSVGIWQAGRPSVFGFGRTGYHDPRPPNADALFEMGTLGDVLVGILLEEMIARGRARLDDPVHGMLPERVTLPEGEARTITLRQLALHTSGLPHVPGVDRSIRDQDALGALVARTKLETPPGQRWQPSNLGTALLGHALATREGSPIGALLQARVATPVGMQSTTTFERTVALDETRLVEGRDASGRRATPRFDVPLLAAHALRTSVNDLLRLLAVVLSPPPSAIGVAVGAALSVRRALGDGTEVALGWRADPATGIVWQVGDSEAFRTALLVDRARARAVAIAVGAAAVDARGLIFEIAREESLPSSRAVRPVGPTVRALPPGTTPSNVVIGDVVRFVGHRVESPVARPGQSVQVALYWQCLARVGQDLQVLVAGVDEHGRERLRIDHYPAYGRYPTGQWRPGEIVVDELTLTLPSGYDAGRITLWLGLGAGGGNFRPAPGPEVDLAGRIRGPSVEVTAKWPPIRELDSTWPER